MPNDPRDNRVRGVAAATAGLVWAAVRLPVLLVVVLLEPVVRVVCAGLAILGLLTTIFFKLVGPPTFPWIEMLTISLGFSILLLAYYALIRLLSGPQR
jgi:hypothetical protein